VGIRKNLRADRELLEVQTGIGPSLAN